MSESKSKLGLLYMDELKGYYKSKLMIVLWIGLPVLSFLVQFFYTDPQELSVSFLVSAVIGSIGGTLSAVMLSTTITGERNRNVYDLYLIRPVKRWQIILVKYFAVITCLFIAIAISLIMGIIVDVVRFGSLNVNILKSTMDSLILSLATISIACTIGVFFGVLINSVAVSAVLAIYVGNQVSSIIILPTIFIGNIWTSAYLALYAISVGVGVSAIILVISLVIFQKKSQY